MNRLDQRRFTGSLLVACAVSTGCAQTGDLPSPTPAGTAVSARAASPSEATTALLPSAANYYLALGQAGDLGVLISSSDGRIWGRVYLDGGDAEGGVRLAFEHDGHPRLALEVRGAAGVLDGQATADDLAVSWRAAATASGQLQGQRWSTVRDSPQSCAQLRHLHAIADDVSALGPSLADAAAWTETDRRALVERLALATLALELSTRACERRGRATLPAITAPFAWR